MKKFFTFFAVAAMALASQANVLTVCDGTEENSNVPISGFNYDLRNTMSQMIYPADMLTDMLNGKITEVRFYATAGFALGQNNIQLSFKQVEQNDFAEVTNVTGTVAVANGSTIPGETELVFTLDEPYEYTGDNLLIETLLTVAGNFKTTKFYGQSTEYAASYYHYMFNWSSPFSYTENFLPKVTFTYEPGTTPVEPTDQCAKPEGGFENGQDFHGVMVTLINNETAEGTELHYNITKDGELIIEDAIYDEPFALTEDGVYYIDFWAEAPGMQASSHGGLIFTIDPTTGLSELLEGKTVAGVRYFNLAGQEMQQAEGLTIVVTTYTDGTSSAVKVVF